MTLLIVVVTIAVAAIIAAAAVPVLAGHDNLMRAKYVQSILNSLDTSVWVGKTSFNTWVGNMPARLSELNVLPVAKTDGFCNATSTFTSNAVTVWKAAAPYSGLFIGKSGLAASGAPTSLGMIKDTLLGSAALNAILPVPPNASGSGNGNIGFMIDSMSTEDAENLNQLYDSGVTGTDSATGSVRWFGSSLAGAHTVIIMYVSNRC